MLELSDRALEALRDTTDPIAVLFAERRRVRPELEEIDGESELLELVNKLAGEVLRLRALFPDLSRAAIRAGELQDENRAMREYAGLAHSPAPALAAKVQKLELNVAELEAKAAKDYERIVELENARAASLKSLGDVKASVAMRLLNVRTELGKVPDCAVCRDAPKMGECVRCRRRA